MDRMVLRVTDKAFFTILNLVFFFLRLPLGLGLLVFVALGFCRAGAEAGRRLGVLALGRGVLPVVDVRLPVLEETVGFLGADEDTGLFFFGVLDEEDLDFTELADLFGEAVRLTAPCLLVGLVVLLFEFLFISDIIIYFPSNYTMKNTPFFIECEI